MTYNPEQDPGLQRNELGPVGDRIFVLRQAREVARKFDYLLMEERVVQQKPAPRTAAEPEATPEIHDIQSKTISRVDEARDRVANVIEAIHRGAA